MPLENYGDAFSIRRLNFLHTKTQVNKFISLAIMACGKTTRAQLFTSPFYRSGPAKSGFKF